MPVNSFENYPMSWKPNKRELTSPVYLCLADMMEHDITNGELCANTKLPPQRELADYLDLNLSTITKAYKLCEMRGLIHAVIGKGTFVTPNANVPTSIIEKDSHPDVEMATIHPFYVHNELIRDLTIELLKKPFSERLFEYSHPLGNQAQIRTAVKWLQRFELDADEHNTLISSGVQNALATILSSLFEAGDRIAVDTYTYSNFISLANLLHIQLVAVEGDRDGMRADLLESICAMQKIKGIYLMPTGANPTNFAFSETRIQEIGKIIREKNLIAIEDDNYAALMENSCKPISLEAPENSIYISGLSKPVCPGLRIAYIKIPSRFEAEVERGTFSQNLKISSLNIEIATEIIQSGMDLKIMHEKRELAKHRNQIYQGYFPSAPCCAESYYQWLELPPTCSGRICEIELAHQRIGVFGAERFAVGSLAKHNAIRIATCSPQSDELLFKGLESIKKYIAHLK